MAFRSQGDGGGRGREIKQAEDLPARIQSIIILSMIFMTQFIQKFIFVDRKN